MTGRWALPPLAPGDMAPAFTAVSRTNPKFHFSAVAGRHLLLGFLPRDPDRRDAAYAAVRPLLGRFDGHFAAAFLIARETDGPALPVDEAGLRWFFDPKDEVGPTFRLAPDEGAWVLCDPAMRVVALAPLETPAPVFDRLAAGLPPLGSYGGVPLVAPALIVPRVFDPAFCRRLIDLYEERGGEPSGVMRDIGGRTVGVLDPMKSRRDVNLQDHEALRSEVVARLDRALSPMMIRTFQFRPTRVERHIVACYDAAEGGYFRPHRDNEALATAHRRFACSINLNAEDFEGGDLRFPEFGDRTYRPPTGGAVVFACNLLHEATPVTRGRRYAFLPFLYDEEGQAIRDRNLTYLAKAEPAASGA